MNRIAKHRERLGISQRKLANDLGVSSATVAMWETGRRTPSLKTANLIARYFNTTIESIFFSEKDNDK